MKNKGKKNAMINSKNQNRKYLERSTTAHKNRQNLQTISGKKNGEIWQQLSENLWSGRGNMKGKNANLFL